MTVGSLTGIAIYPIKSCRRVELDRVELSETGLAGDREWQIVAADGTAITQRHNRVLATIEPVLMADGLRISAPGQRSIEVTRPPANDRSVFALLGDEVPVGDAGEVVAAWLTELLGKPSRLVALTRESDRRIDLVKAQAVTFVDAAPVLVTNAASLADLEARATASFGMERFRPNLVVDASAPWVEDTWTRLDVGGSRLRTLMSWPRCAIPQIDQDTAERSKEPALVLRGTPVVPLCGGDATRHPCHARRERDVRHRLHHRGRRNIFGGRRPRRGPRTGRASYRSAHLSLAVASGRCGGFRWR